MHSARRTTSIIASSTPHLSGLSVPKSIPSTHPHAPPHPAPTVTSNTTPFFPPRRSDITRTSLRQVTEATIRGVAYICRRAPPEDTYKHEGVRPPSTGARVASPAPRPKPSTTSAPMEVDRRSLSSNDAVKEDDPRDGRVRKRKRLVISCSECHRRKQKVAQASSPQPLVPPAPATLWLTICAIVRPRTSLRKLQVTKQRICMSLRGGRCTRSQGPSQVSPRYRRPESPRWPDPPSLRKPFDGCCQLGLFTSRGLNVGIPQEDRDC